MEIEFDESGDICIVDEEPFTEKLNATDLCRLCANTDNQLMPIFRGEGLEHNISSKIKKHLPIINISESDNLPLQICYQCASTLISWHNLYEGCPIANKRLHEILDKKYQDISIENDVSLNNFEPKSLIDENTNRFDDFSDDNQGAKFSSTESPRQMISIMPSDNLIVNVTTDELINEERLETVEAQPADTSQKKSIDIDEEKWDPLIKNSEIYSEFVAIDRAKLINSEKFLEGACAEGDGSSTLQYHKCNICSAFFLRKENFQNHKKCHDFKGSSTFTAPRLILPKSSSGTCSVKRLNLLRCGRKLGSTFIGRSPTAAVLKTNKIRLVALPPGGQHKSKTNTEQEEVPSLQEQQVRQSGGKKVEVNSSTTTKKLRSPKLRRASSHAEAEGHPMYTCAYCLRIFRRKSNLKRHMCKLHNEKKSDEPASSSSSRWFTGYCCDVCGEGLQRRATMMAHRDTVHGEQPEMEWCTYQTSLARVKYCERCKKYYRAGRLFHEHACDGGLTAIQQSEQQLKVADQKLPSFCCDVCGLCFGWKWDYRWHREAEHKDSATTINWARVSPCTTSTRLRYACSKCSIAYASGQELAGHQCHQSERPTADKRENGAAAKPFCCELCGNAYYWKSDFRRHVRIKHPKELFKPTEHDTILYTCPYCAEQFSMKKRVLQHIRKAHEIDLDSPFVCVPCNKVFRRRDNLDRHHESYHAAVRDDEADAILKAAEIRINGELVYHCPQCSRNMELPNRFISHYKAHYSENKFTCDLCGKQTKTQHQLNAHIKNIHLNIRNFKCDFCQKSFYTNQACEEHIRIHTGERPFSCEICGKTFVAGNALISHKRFHTDFFPHSCHLCPKKFKVRRSLTNHVRTHTGERPFKCDICPKTFNNSSQYSYHMKVTHSDERPYSCQVCGNNFKANKFLSRHLQLHKETASAEQPSFTRKRSVDKGDAKAQPEPMEYAVTKYTQEGTDVAVSNGVAMVMLQEHILENLSINQIPPTPSEEISMTLYNVHRNF